MSNLTKKTFSGLSWTIVSAVLTLVMQLTYTSVMARLLIDKDFGVMTLALTIVNFGGFFTNMGIGKALVQKETINNNDVRAAFTSNMSLGLVLYAAIFLSADFLANVFVSKENMSTADWEQLKVVTAQILRLISLTLIISGFSSISVNLLRRDMKFKTISIINFVAFFVGYLIVGIGLGMSGFGVWSLASAGLSQGIITATVAYLMVRHTLLPTVIWDHFKPLLAYGSKVTFNTLIEFASDNVNTYLIGPFLGMGRLGVYSQGRKLIFLPVHVLIANVNRVIFPAFSRLNTDYKKLKEAYLTVLTMVTLFLAPVTIGMSAAAREVVLTVLGDKWGDSIIILQILSIAIFLRYIVFFASTICDSIAKLNMKMVINIIWLVVGVVGFFALRGFGLPGLACAVLIGEVVRNILFMRLMNRYLGVTLYDFYKAYSPGLIAAAIVGGAIYGVTQLTLWLGVPISFVVIIQIATGGIALGTKVIFFPGKVLTEKILFFFDRLNVKNSKQPTIKKLYHLYLNYLNVKPQAAGVS